MENLLPTKLDSNPGAISAVFRQVRASEDGIQIDLCKEERKKITFVTSLSTVKLFLNS